MITPLFQAIQANNEQEVNHIFSNPAAPVDINDTDINGYWKTPLCFAVHLNFMNIVKIMLNSKRLDINQQIHPTFGKSATALHEAVLNANVEMIEYLLSMGADPNIRVQINNLEWNALHLLAFHKNLIPQTQNQIALLLLNNGADPFCEDIAPYTPYNIALMYQKNELATTIFNWTPNGFSPSQILEYKTKHSHYTNMLLIKEMFKMKENFTPKHDCLRLDYEQLKIRQQHLENRFENLATNIEKSLAILEKILSSINIRPQLQKMPSELNQPLASPPIVSSQGENISQQLSNIGIFKTNPPNISNDNNYPTFFLPTTLDFA